MVRQIHDIESRFVECKCRMDCVENKNNLLVERKIHTINSPPGRDMGIKAPRTGEKAFPWHMP
jgi:hypothetical protein